ncbi:MAG: alpha/beta hydrolase [Parvularcula sp.]
MAKAPVIQIKENPVPDGIRFEYIEARDGSRLRIACLPCENPRGTFLVHPGWAEFIEKYFEVAQDLHARGFNVVLVDPRGQGFSQRAEKNDRRGLITDFRQFRDDFGVFVETMEARFDGPYFLLAHSMGGLISLDWLAHEDHKKIAGVVLSAPLTRLFPSRIKRAIVRNLARWAVILGGAARHLSAAPEHSMHFESNILTQDPRRHERFRLLQLAAPEAQAGRPRFGWLNAAMMTMLRLSRPNTLKRIGVPVLLVSADRDETVDPTHHHILDAEHDHINLVRIEGARHEVLMERDEYRKAFWQAFDSYVEDRLSAVRAKYPPEDSSAMPSSTRSSNISAT